MTSDEIVKDLFKSVINLTDMAIKWNKFRWTFANVAQFGSGGYICLFILSMMECLEENILSYIFIYIYTPRCMG